MLAVRRQSSTDDLDRGLDVPPFLIDHAWSEEGQFSCESSASETESIIPWLLAEQCGISEGEGADVCDGFLATMFHARVTADDMTMMPRRFSERSEVVARDTERHHTQVWKVGTGLFMIGFDDPGSTTSYYLTVLHEGELEIASGKKPTDLNEMQIENDPRVIKIYYSSHKSKHVMCSGRDHSLFINIRRTDKKIVAVRTHERNATAWDMDRDE